MIGIKSTPNFLNIFSNRWDEYFTSESQEGPKQKQLFSSNLDLVFVLCFRISISTIVVL